MDYDCNSLCQTNLFYIHKDMSEGSPQVDNRECVAAPGQVWGQQYNERYIDFGKVTAGLAISLGIVMLLSLFFVIPLIHRVSEKYT